jgi:hypothetical protein
MTQIPCVCLGITCVTSLSQNIKQQNESFTQEPHHKLEVAQTMMQYKQDKTRDRQDTSILTRIESMKPDTKALNES